MLFISTGSSEYSTQTYQPFFVVIVQIQIYYFKTEKCNVSKFKKNWSAGR